MMQCIIRDHHYELRRLIAQYEPEPNDENGALICSIQPMQVDWRIKTRPMKRSPNQSGRIKYLSDSKMDALSEKGV